MEEENKKVSDYEINKEEVEHGLVRVPEGLTEEQKALNLDKIKIVVGDAYEKIMEILKTYVDLREEYYPLLSTWIIGTYMHREFNTFPYLFINAMRGSGKTRLLKLISSLAHNGEVISSLREAVLFRDCKDKTICIDEFENIMSKENQALRELLNAGYKKGNKVKRMKRVKGVVSGVVSEDYVVEEFEVYTPIAMANIWGMEEVLSDRCITLVLEKSSNEKIMKLLEDFEQNDDIFWCKNVLKNNLVQLCSYFLGNAYLTLWNEYIHTTYTTYTTLTTFTTPTTPTTQMTPKKLKDLETFQKINDTGINGRNLELMFPLFLTARMIGEEPFDNMLKIAKTITLERKGEEMTESRDVSLIDFVSKQMNGNFIPIKLLTLQFKEFVGEDEGDERWINSKWVGRGLKRLNLILDKTRHKNGIEVRLDISKALEKIKIFERKK